MRVAPIVTSVFQAIRYQTRECRILAVGDGIDLPRVSSRFITQLGHEAYDGIRAVEPATELRHDVVLMDIGLPGVDGYEADGCADDHSPP